MLAWPKKLIAYIEGVAYKYWLKWFLNHTKCSEHIRNRFDKE